MRTEKTWNDINTKKPKPYQVIHARGKWECKKVLYLDDEQNGWEQKKNGQIEVTHWREVK